MSLSAPTPSHVGAYLIRGVIGSGAMGMVYLAHDPAIDRPVVVKTIHRHLLDCGGDDPSVAARFRVEAQAAGRLTHRNIVSVYQFAEDGDCAYIAMEYVAGRNLREYIQSPRKLEVGQVLCLMLQLLDGLHYAHERGVVHRDVKPANLLVADDGRLKITDFGIARMESSNLTRANFLIGSPGYIAPEQYTDRSVDRRVDVFAAGVLLYQMLSGATPFSGTDEAIMYKIVYEPHKPLSEATNDPTLHAFDAVLDRALAKDPARRYPSALAMRMALLELATEPLPDLLPTELVLPPRIHVSEVKDIPSISPDASAASGALPAAPNSTPQSAPGQASIPVPTGWEMEALAEVERELAQHIGPVARVLVRRAARGLTSLAAVRQAVAPAIVEVLAREQFLARAAAAVSDAGAPASGSLSRPSIPTGNAATGVPMRDGDIDKAAAALVTSLGPIARVVARRCAADSDTREQFVARVLDQLAPTVDARRVRADLWRVLG
jgi:serine/threonine-protein kinase